MMYQDDQITAMLFAGHWVGQTQGRQMPAHIWEIIPRETHLEIRNWWEGETTFGIFHAKMVPGEPAFRLSGNRQDFKATLIDKQHFVIPNWCDGRGGEGPYDVVFSRPGIAELTAKDAYQKFLQDRGDA